MDDQWVTWIREEVIPLVELMTPIQNKIVPRSMDHLIQKVEEDPDEDPEEVPQEDLEEDLEEELEEDPEEGGAMHVGDGPIPVARDNNFEYESIGFYHIEGLETGPSSSKYYRGFKRVCSFIYLYFIVLP